MISEPVSTIVQDLVFKKIIITIIFKCTIKLNNNH